MHGTSYRRSVIATLSDHRGRRRCSQGRQARPTSLHLPTARGSRFSVPGLPGMSLLQPQPPSGSIRLPGMGRETHPPTGVSALRQVHLNVGRPARASQPVARTYGATLSCRPAQDTTTKLKAHGNLLEAQALRPTHRGLRRRHMPHPRPGSGRYADRARHSSLTGGKEMPHARLLVP